MLSVKSHPMVKELLVVTDDSLPKEGGQVVARYHTTSKTLTLTPHGKGRRAEIKAMVA